MKHTLNSLLAFAFIATIGTEITQATCPCVAPVETKKETKTNPVNKQQFDEICKAIGLEGATLESLQNSDECQKMAIEIAKSFAIKMVECQAKTNEQAISEDVSTQILMQSLEQLSEKYETDMLKKGFALFVMHPEAMMQNPEVMKCIEQANPSCQAA